MLRFIPVADPAALLRLALLCAAAALAGCVVGPDYVRPTLQVPAAYKEAQAWQSAQPGRADADSAWWQAYGDAALDDLVRQANDANPGIAQAEAQYRQAQALAAAARAAYWPTLGVSAAAGRAQTNNNGRHLGSAYGLSAGASWEPDLWGGVRRRVEAGEAGAAASADDLAAARLSMQGALVQNYLLLRVSDLQSELYAATIAAYERSLQLTRSQYAAGVVLRSDVALAETQLKSTQAQAADLQVQRSQLEHAIAVLIGKPPAVFALAPLPAGERTLAQLRQRLPAIPVGVPSQLLQRRPDIAAAERRAAAANASIGVARAAYFPALNLSAGAGFSSGSLGLLFDTPARVWSLGAVLAQTLFDGGLREAHDQQAVAAYDGAVAAYKATVLAGFQAVEDNLAALAILQRESALQDEAVAAARLAERSTLSQYRAGTASYLGVVAAQLLALSNERTAVQLLGRQLTASVALVTATGGGWRVDEDPAALAAK